MKFSSLFCQQIKRIKQIFICFVSTVPGGGRCGSEIFTRFMLVLLLLLLVACGTPTPSAPETFSGELAYAWVTRQCDLGYRITGTEANRQAGDMFIDELRAQGWEVYEQEFTYKETPVRNILAWKGESPEGKDAVLVGAHYDTRRSADMEDPSQPVLGANDGASGVAVLLELARVVEWDTESRRIYLAFFDAEDNGRLDGWEWIVGSSYMAAHWGEPATSSGESAGESPLAAMVLVDMIGDADQQIYYERNSDPTLSQTLWAIAAQLGYGDRIIPQPRHAMLDDHIPFVQKGIPAALMIDFDYPYWHTLQDTPDKVSAESLEAVGRTVEFWLESLE
jgi:glutaminyl-peptide cyclotransferase